MVELVYSGVSNGRGNAKMTRLGSQPVGYFFIWLLTQQFHFLLQRSRLLESCILALVETKVGHVTVATPVQLQNILRR